MLRSTLQNHVTLLVLISMPAVHSIAFDPATSLHVWITISSLANKDPSNAKSLLFRQIELNWINAPLEDANDYIALYLDTQPDDESSLPVSVHKLNGHMSGRISTDHYLPQLDFSNHSAHADSNQNQREFDESLLVQPTKHDHLPRAQLTMLHAHPQIYLRPYQQLRPRGTRRFSPEIEDSMSTTNDLPRAQPTSSQLVDQCVGYCVAYHSRDQILASNCLKTNPNWMRDSFQYIARRSLPSLMLPGTHNSGTYPRQLDKTVLQMINKYQMNQDESIYNQLVYGIRHLDLRIGYTRVKSRPERLWIYHDIFRTDVSLNDVLSQVKRFLDSTSHEIVIMDFHRFTVGFQNEDSPTQRERHAKMIDLIFKQVGSYIVPSYLGLHAPINEYISMGKRLIIGHAERATLLAAGGNANSNYLALMAANSDRKPVRDIDAVKQDYEDSMGNTNNNETSLNIVADQQPPETVDRRVGTRIYNKLKSLKLISNSFSKRSPKSTRDHVISSQKLASGAHEADDYYEPSLTEQEYDSSLARVALFFPPVKHLWPNKDTLEGLAQYMNDTTCRKYFGELRSMMVELTPTVFGVLSDKYDGNRKLAQHINRHVTDWIRDRWLHCINIVASDFFLGNDLVRLSIYANKMRLVHKNVDLNHYGQCGSFRKVEHLLDQSKIPAQFAVLNQWAANESPDQLELLTHTSPSGKRYFLKSLVAPTGSLGSSHTSNHLASGQRERRDSFVDNVSDGFSDIFSSLKRLFNL